MFEGSLNHTILMTVPNEGFISVEGGVILYSADAEQITPLVQFQSS
jgi:hypothetical protein